MADLLLAAVVLRRPEHALAAQVLSLALSGLVRVEPTAPASPPALVLLDPVPGSERERVALSAVFGDDAGPGARVVLDPADDRLRARVRAAARDVVRGARRDGYLEPGRARHLTEKGEAVRAELVALEDAVEREVADARAHDHAREHVSSGALPWAVLFGHEPGWVPVDRRTVRFDVAAVCAAADALR
ncbi:hypothetical protein ACFVSK_07935 [Cellulosimicrobium cellulans]|uniref:Uncharacterized protein n=1 Tax=Cellulosimicrobium cellulans F16 TaxID=1350482 RepID=A0A0M0F8F2_CELCE|nr:hypothetical protein [Cellulosimicrobium cellulans]KON73880.1 hypothetical protein M768_07185 [Cellulosimicrobium cellulans F16]